MHTKPRLVSKYHNIIIITVWHNTLTGTYYRILGLWIGWDMEGAPPCEQDSKQLFHTVEREIQ